MRVLALWCIYRHPSLPLSPLSTWGCSYKLPAPQLTPRVTCSPPCCWIGLGLSTSPPSSSWLIWGMFEGAATGRGHVAGNKLSLAVIPSLFTQPWRLKRLILAYSQPCSMTVNKDGGILPTSADICVGVCCHGSAGRQMIEVMAGVTPCLNTETGQVNQWIKKNKSGIAKRPRM